MNDRADILRRAQELSPWHFDFEILPGVKTASLNDPNHPDLSMRQVESIDPSEIVPILREYYPSGLPGKDVLDVGCNAGGYCFMAHELGARSATGVEVRQHWIDQAEWIKSLKYPNAGDAIRFEVSDLRPFLVRQNRQFDIVIFKGVFYHLADPIGTLLSLCDATREFLLIDTASSDLIPEHCLAPIAESTTQVMSGVDGLAWLPGGPGAIRPALQFKGFQSIQLVFWRHGITQADRGRFRLVASRRLHVRGSVDFFKSPDVLRGWARQEGSEDPLEVRVLLQGTQIGTGRTGLERPSGNCGFSVTLSQRITATDIRSHAVNVYAVDSGGQVHEIPIATERLLRVQGSVDIFKSPNVLGGWARQEGSEELLEVRVLLNGPVVGTGRTGLERLHPGGNCGFILTLTQPITLEDIRSNRVKVHAITPNGDICELPIWPKLLADPAQTSASDNRPQP
jgi:tRNA (mo5U34)-methyltransferase